MAVSLGSRPYPTPPILPFPVAPRVFSSPTTPRHTQASNPIRLRTPGTQHSGRDDGFSSPRTPRIGNRFLTSPSPSPSSQITAVAALLAREEAFRADLEDFWVVFTGAAPGVHQGRQVLMFSIIIIYAEHLFSEAAEQAFGQYGDPLFVRTSARDQANQIFVDGYMKLQVVRYVN